MFLIYRVHCTASCGSFSRTSLNFQWFFKYFYLNIDWGLTGGTSGKEPTCQCRRWKRCGFDPSVGKIPWRRAWLIHLSILAWRIPWTEEPGGLQFKGCTVGRDWHDLAHIRRLNTCQFIIGLHQNQSLILISQFALWKFQFSPRFNLKPQSALSFILRFQNFNILYSMLIHPAYSLLPSNVLDALFKASPLYFRQRYQLGNQRPSYFQTFSPNTPQILYLLPKHYMTFCICVLYLSSFLPPIYLNFYFLNVTSASTKKCHY